MYIPYPKNEEKCLRRGQKLTDGMMDYLADRFFSQYGSADDYWIPTFITRLMEIDWSAYAGYKRVFAVMHQNDHWFLMMLDNRTGVFHLYDNLPSEEESCVDIQELPIGEQDLIEDYYGKIPSWPRLTNCGIFTLLNFLHLLLDCPMRYDPSPKHINQTIRPYLSRLVADSDLIPDVEILCADHSRIV